MKEEKIAHKVQDLALHDEVVQPIHDFLDASFPVPPMQVQNVDVCGAQLFETGFDADVHRFDVVPDIGYPPRDVFIAGLEVAGVLQLEFRSIHRVFPTGTLQTLVATTS